MKYIIFILLILCALNVDAQVAQLNIDKTAYPNATTVVCSDGTTAPYNKTSTNNNYTSAIFTSNPRIENGFFLVDIYFVRGGVKDPNDYKSPVNEIWENSKHFDCSDKRVYGSIGSFLIGFKCLDFTGLGANVGFLGIFELNGSSFELDPIFSSSTCRSTLVFANFKMSPSAISVAYNQFSEGEDRDDTRYGVRLEANTPLLAGVLKLKLKSAPLVNETRLSLAESAMNVTVFNENKTGGCSWYVAGGYLDGKDINIPLTEEPEGPKAPDAPTITVPSTTELCLGKDGTVNFTYSIAEANKKDSVYWFVSNQNVTTISPVGNAVATWTPASGSQTTTVTWKQAGTYWVNAYVRSNYLQNSGHSDIANSEIRHIQITVKDRPQAQLSFDKSAYRPTDGRILATVSDESSLTGSKTYGWLRPGTATGATYTQGSIAAGQSFQFQAYVQAANGCRDTSAIETKIVGDNPKLTVEVEEVYALCAGGVGELRVSRVTTENGDEVALGSCTFAWKNGATTVSSAANCAVSAAGTYSVTVSGGGAEGTVSRTVTQSSNTAPTLTDKNFYVRSQTSKPVVWVGVNNGSEENLTWNWSPAANLSSATVARPTVTSGLTTAAAGKDFTVYAVDANNCRSRDAKANVKVNGQQGLDVTIDPGEAITLCRGNHRYLTAKVNGTLGTALSGYTYEWTPGTYLSATSGPQVVFNATNAGTYEVFVTATKGSYSSTQKITVTVKSDEAPTIQKNTSADWLACTGSELEVIVIPLAPTGSTNYYMYAWTNDGKTIGGNTNPFTFEADGEYDMSLKVTAPNGCEADTVNWPHMTIRTVPQNLVLKLSGDFGTDGTVLCGGSGRLELSYSGTKPEIIKWYRNGVEVTAAQNQTTLAVTEGDAGSTYKVVASNGVCEATTTDFTFTSTSLPASLAIDVVESCGELVLSATPVDGFNNWEWSAGSGLTAVGGTTASTVRYTGTSYGNYTVNLTAKNGQQCYKTATETVALKQKPEVQWAANNPTHQCEGDVLRVTADMDIKTYTWKNGTITAASKTNGYALPLYGGTIMAIVTAENGCADTVSGSFAGHSKPDLAWTVEPASKYYAGETIKAAVRATKGDGTYHYYYTSPYTLDNTTGDGQDYMAQINGTNDFFVMVADNHGCRDTLRKAVAVEGQDLVVDIENKHDVYACAGGSAILTAKVQHGVGTLTYQWYKNNAAIAGATDSVYVVNFGSSNVTSESYKVVVNCPATEGTGEATKSWSGTPGTAAELTVLADVITIVPGDVALLGANAWSPNSTTFNWHWSDAKNFSDVSKLAAGEDTKQFPHTTALRVPAAYKVYAIDDRGCMTNIGDVQVNLDDDAGLRVNVDPLRSELCRNNSVELKANANLEIDAIEWYPTEFGNDDVTLKANGTGSVVFAAGNNSVPKDYQVVVKVKSGNSYALALATVTVKSERAPKLPAINDGCGGKTISILIDGVNDDGFVWYVDGELLADNHSWQHVFDNNDHAVKVVMKSSDCDCWSDTLRFNVWQSPVIEGDMIVDKTTVQVNDKANLEVTLSEATSNYAGMTGVWSTTPAGYEGTATGKHNRLMTTGGLKVENTTVTYTISNTRNAKCSATKSAHLTVFDPNTGFKLSLSDKVLAKCEGDPVQVTVTPINADGVKVNYELTGTKNGDPFEKLESTRDGVIGPWTTNYTDLEAGSYQLFIAATETQKGSIARDTLTFTVYPNPTVSMGTLASTSLCVGSGDSLAVVLTLGNGSPWTLEYRDGGAAQKAIENITTTDYTVYLKRSGDFSVMSVENTHGCRIVNTANTLPSATITDLTPKITLVEDGLVSFCGSDDNKAKVTMNLSGGTPDWKIYYRLSDDGKQYSASANDSPYELALTEGGKLKVDSVVNLEGCRAEITSGRFFDGVDVPDDRLKVEFLTAEPESICSDGNTGATIALNITPEPRTDQWNLAVNCMIHMEDGSDRQLDVEIKPTDKDKDGHYLLKNIVHRGTYLLTSITDGGGCKGSIGANDTKVMQVGTLPEVHIDSTDFVAFKGDEFVLNAVDKKDDFTYSWSLNDGEAVEDNGGVRGTMGDEDMVYRLIARDGGGCVAEDTVTVYRLPDAPDVNIVKEDSVTLKITWEHNGLNTNGYRVWHNEWDAYAMEIDYTEWGKSYGSTAAPEAVLRITEQDTLEFFYVVAFREIDLKDGQGRRRFISLPSDTVGYKQDIIIMNSDPSKPSNNLVSWVFEMENVKTSADLYEFVGLEALNAINAWNQEEQGWYITTTPNFLYVPGDPIELKYDGSFDLRIGAVYMLDANISTTLLQYGKLPPRCDYDMTTMNVDKVNNFVVFLGLHKIYLKNTSEVYRELVKENLNAISLWSFEDQEFYKTVTPSFLYVPGADPSTEFDEEYDVMPTIPLLLDVEQPLQWK